MSAGESEAKKTPTPAVVEYVIWEDSTDSWGPVADHAQGDDIPYRLTASLAQDLDAQEAYPYWIVIRPDSGLTYEPDSARVACLHADGTRDDVTVSLQVGLDASGRIVAGTQDIKAAIPDVSATDKLVLTYSMHFNDGCYLGLARGNESYGHVEYGQGSESTARQPVSRAASWVVAPVRLWLPALRAQATAPSDATKENGETVEVSGTNLTSSPELKVTAHTYVVRIHKYAAGTTTPLADARFSLRDSSGRWFVQGEAWNANQAKATVRQTDARGYAEFVGVDAEAYDLVEVQAPRGYLAIDPVDIALASDFDEKTLKVSTRSGVALEVDAQGGTLTAKLADPAKASSPRTADPLPTPWLVGALSLAALALLCAAEIVQGKEMCPRKILFGPSRKEQ